MRIRVLYLTRTILSTPDNGGALVCRSHVSRIARDPRLDVKLCAIAGAGGEIETQNFAKSIGVQLFNFFPHHATPPPPADWPFFLEMNALAFPQTDAAVLSIVEETKPDVVAIDYLYTALYAPSLFRVPVRKVLITLNREYEFQVELRRRQGLPADPSEARLAEFERSVCNACNAIVALTRADLPAEFAEKGRTISALFAPAAEQWSYRDSKNLLFIGNISSHYPNYLAVEWLCTQLAPSLSALRPDISIQIIGAHLEDVPSGWRQPNVRFLGVGDSSLVKERLLQTDLFIAPISNNFGSKIKLLDCLSHSTPFVATEGAMSGLSFLVDVPRIKLDDPLGAAEIVSGYLNDKDVLKNLSASLARQLSQTLIARARDWGDLFESVMSNTAPSMDGIGVLDLNRAKLQLTKFADPLPVERDPERAAALGRVSRRMESCPCGSGKRYKHCHGRFG